MIPRTIFQPDHEMYRDSVRRFLEAEAVPHHDRWEKAGQVDREFWHKAGEVGLLCPTMPEEYGGAGADFLYSVIVWEELAALGLTGPGFPTHSDIVTPYIIRKGTEEQKQKYLPRCVTGEIVTAISMTEPSAGSDLMGIKTQAVRTGDHYVINGSKIFTSNGQLADLFIVVCKTDPSAGAKGFSLFLVEADSPGFSRGANLEKIGLKAQDTSELFFQDVSVPKENLLGGEGNGFKILMQELAQERLYVAVTALTSAEAVLEETVRYTKERHAFGRAIATFQNTQFKLAGMAAKISATRVFIDKCMELHLEGGLDAVTAAKAKLLCTELQGEVMDECVQLHGGYGYMWEYPVARAYADARVSRIVGGTNEIMKLIIGRALLD